MNVARLTRILIVDDHVLVRAGIRALLEKLPGVEVIAEASEGRAALESISNDNPDIVLMDIAMPGLNGLEATRRIVRNSGKTRVIILSMHASEEYVWQALRAGACGYLLKGGSFAELGLAIESVCGGEIYLSPPISKQLIMEYLQRTGAEGRTVEVMTSRQREILQLIAEGKSTKQIALVLKISVKTVETHRAHLMRRIGVSDVASMVRYAIRTGLVDAE